MPAPYTNLDSKAERAVAQTLVLAGCGSLKNITPSEWRGDKSYPNATVSSGVAVEETFCSGRYTIPIFISIKGSAAIVNAADTPAVARKNFDAFVAAIADALLLTANNQDYFATVQAITAAGQSMAVDLSNGADPDQKQFAADNADMADFCCQVWQRPGFGKGKADEEGCSWERILTFEGVFCASAIS